MGCGSCSRLAYPGRRDPSQKPGDDPMGPICSSEIQGGPFLPAATLVLAWKSGIPEASLSLHFGWLDPPTQNWSWRRSKKSIASASGGSSPDAHQPPDG